MSRFRLLTRPTRVGRKRHRNEENRGRVHATQERHPANLAEGHEGPRADQHQDRTLGLCENEVKVGTPDQAQRDHLKGSGEQKDCRRGDPYQNECPCRHAAGAHLRSEFLSRYATMNRSWARQKFRHESIPESERWIVRGQSPMWVKADVKSKNREIPTSKTFEISKIPQIYILG